MFSKVKQNYRREKKSIISFLGVGAVTAIVYLCLFTLLNSYLKFNNFSSLTVAYLLAVTFYFFANRHFTFKPKHQDETFTQIGKFIILLLINYLITVVTVSFCQRMLYLSAQTGIIFSILLTTVFSYFFAKFIIFKSPPMSV